VGVALTASERLDTLAQRFVGHGARKKSAIALTACGSSGKVGSL
jgi:hypothetical protein